MATSASQIRSPFFRHPRPPLSLSSKPSLSAFSVTPASRRRALPRLVVVLSATERLENLGWREVKIHVWWRPKTRQIIFQK
ncbi:hypothetical protein ACFX13_032245 [Malus domestica]